MIDASKRGALVAMVILFFSVPVYGQKKKPVAKPAADTNAMLSDRFYGTLLDGDDSIITVLQLDHRQRDNFGFFTLDQVEKRPDGRVLQLDPINGEWSISKGTANSEDAIVVQLEGEDRMMFFLRQNDSTLQKLTPTKEETLATESYLLRRKINQLAAKKDTLSPLEMAMRRFSGKYVGNLPCSDCNSVLSTLILKYNGRGKTGDYTLIDKYMGARSGDITNERKGKWTSTLKHTGNIIIIDADKRGRESYYLTNKNGSITPLDRNQRKIEGTADLTLKKQQK